MVDPSTDKEEAAADARELVGKLLAILSPADRLVISLVYLEEHPSAGVSALTGFSRAP